MPDITKQLYRGQPGVADTLLYTAPAGAPTVVRSITITNTTGAQASITLGTNAGGALAVANHLLSAYPVPGNGILIIEPWEVIDASGTIRGLQGTSGALTVHINGVEQA